MSPEELKGALDAAPDADGVRQVVRSCAARLRGPNDDDRIGLVDLLLPLAQHPVARVRRAVADACDLFPGPLFDETLKLLSTDLDGFVRAAAQAAGERRAELRRRAERIQEADHLTGEIASALEAKHGKGALQLARRLAKREVEQYQMRLGHETSKIDGALLKALDAVDAELARPDASLGRLRVSAAALRERMDFQRSLLVRAREYTREVRPAFARQRVAEMVDEARRHLDARLGGRAAALRLTIDIPPALHLHADRHAFLQALQNLLQNAVEAYDPAAAEMPLRVVARALGQGTEVELQVEDRGAGISEEARARLFLPFQTTKAGGTGVGLLIARKMVEEVHGGVLVIASTYGEGTTVILTFPARQSGVKDRS
ncbi:MAG TPA: ATP-binding protein [Polyangiaceae bacterium]|jgi:signal transduction histidine kinase